MKRLFTTGLLALSLAGAAVGQVQHGILNVVELDGGDLPTSIVLTRLPGGFGAWTPISSDTLDASSRADYVVDFGTGADDVNGILISSPYQNSRIEPSVGATEYYATTASVPTGTGSGRYQISVFQSSSGAEVNLNAALAYFPIADGWFGGAAYNAENGGNITNFVGNPNIFLTNPFDPNKPTFTTAFVDNANGVFQVRTVGIDFRRDGVVIASGAKNEDNYAMINITGPDSFLLLTHDNGANGATFEQDPIAFVFVPDGTPGVTMGYISGSGRKLYHQGDFDVELFDVFSTNGIFRLTIAGESPETGTLLVTANNELAGNTIDNPVWAEPDGNGGWLITSRDIPGMGLQDLGATDIAFSFAFFKNGVAISPATPPQDYLERFDDLASARFDVVEFTPNNGNGDCRADRAFGSDILDIYSDNRGDFGWSYLKAQPASHNNNGADTAEGVFLGAATEFFRDNSLTGGISGWPTFSIDNGEVRLHAATTTGGEINANFAMAFFPPEAGLLMDADVQVPGDIDAVVLPSGTANDGTLIAINWDNNNRAVTAIPNGTQFDIICHDGVNGARVTDFDHGYVYLPYDFASANGIVTGRVDANANVLGGTGDFTTGTAIEPFDQFQLTTINIPGVNANTDGVLLLTPTAGPYTLSWRPAANGDFEVGAYDLSTGIPGPTEFMFAWVPYELDFSNPALLGDMNCDGAVTVSDIAGFVLALTDPAGYAAQFPDCDPTNADANADGNVTVSDIAFFVALLTSL